ASSISTTRARAASSLRGVTVTAMPTTRSPAVATFPLRRSIRAPSRTIQRSPTNRHPASTARTVPAYGTADSPVGPGQANGAGPGSDDGGEADGGGAVPVLSGRPDPPLPGP